MLYDNTVNIIYNKLDVVVVEKIWIYAEQWGMFWRFTPKTFKKMLSDAIKSGHYDLDDCGLRLRTQPRAVKKYSGSSAYYAVWPNLYYHMTDSDEDDWDIMLDDMLTTVKKRNK